MDLKKTITYKNNTYAIDYNFATERGINGKTHHNINIFQVNGKNIAPYNYSWTDMYYNKESIILKAKSAIDEYNKQISVNGHHFHWKL